MSIYDKIAARNAVERAEAEGIVADSSEVRLALMKQVTSGERSLESIQEELKKIKRSAKKKGKITRNQAFIGR